MFFSKIWGRSLTEPRYIRRTRVYLQEARMAILEHSIAAEYYQSSAEMYAARAQRLEQDLQEWEERELRERGVIKVSARIEPAVSAPVSTPSVMRAV